MVSGKVVIKSKTGLHLRPAGDLCNLAIIYPCKIELRTDNRTVNAKSVLGVLSACIKHEDEVELICDGDNEEEAFQIISKALANNFENYHSSLN
jgi:phosphocarrier protein